jgi:hypothetical protein
VLVVALILLVRRSDRPRAEEGIRSGLAYPVPPRDPRVTVEVFNGTDRAGLARVAARLLRREGIDVVNVGNAAATAPVTRVIVRRGKGEHARRVARALGGAEIITAVDSLRRVDLSVVIGADFKPVLPLHP